MKPSEISIEEWKDNDNVFIYNVDSHKLRIKKGLHWAENSNKLMRKPLVITRQNNMSVIIN